MSKKSITQRTKEAATRLGVEPTHVAGLVEANHILYAKGVVDGFGHISLRHSTQPSLFLLSRSMAPAMIGPEDIMCFDMAGKPIDDDRTPYLETFIHSEMFVARPDVNSVVHNHSPSLVPFGIVKSAPLRPLCHLCGFIRHAGAPIFEIRCDAGPETDLLIRSRELGASLARSLGDKAVVLMRGHGSTTVGSSIKRAVFRAYYAEVNAKLRLESSRLGEIEYLTPKEAENASATNDKVIDRSWAM